MEFKTYIEDDIIKKMTFGEDKDIEGIIYLNINQTKKLLKHLKDSFNKEEGLLVSYNESGYPKGTKEGFLKEIMYDELDHRYYENDEIVMIMSGTYEGKPPAYFYLKEFDCRNSNLLRLAILAKESGYTSVRGEFLPEVYKLRKDKIKNT